MRPAGLLRAACAAAIVLCVFGAGPAHAAVVRKVALADLSGFRLEFEAGVSERNLVTVTGKPLVLDVGDRGALEGAFPAGSRRARAAGTTSTTTSSASSTPACAAGPTPCC